MIFGDELIAAESVAPAEWIGPACSGANGTVGALVPNKYPLLLRVSAPDPQPEGWWSEYRRLYEVVASVGARHTSTPDRALFAVWEGHGFDTVNTRIAWRDPAPDEATRHARDEHRAQLRSDDERQNATIRAALNQVPRFVLPDRTYYLLEGSVSAVTQLCYPDSSGDWRNPDLYWPDDRRWFVATDVDFWSLYIGGDSDFIAELTSHLPTRSNMVTSADRLPIEN